MISKAVILIPCYNPNETIMQEFLQELKKHFTNIVLVNDGCTSNYHNFIEKLSLDFPIITHNVNLGKGRALKNGFNYILNNYPDAEIIITADCDGQHQVKDIEKCYKVALKNKDSLILGVRNFNQDNVPFKSKCGNIITRNILKHFVGPKISDTQTGLRALSFEMARNLIEVPGERYEYETNVLIATKDKKKIPIKEVTIDTVYINENETSHFNPIKDSWRIYKFFISYILVTLTAYLLETIFFAMTFDWLESVVGIFIFLFMAKVISTSIIVILNKYINKPYTIINYLIVSLFLILINKNIVLVKVILDIILLIINLCISNRQFKKISA